MSLPVFETKQEAPIKAPFILGTTSKMAQQKKNLSVLETNLQTASDEVKAAYKKQGMLKVHFYEKHHDGNISERGGHIMMEDLMRPIPVVTGTISLGDDTVDGLTFKSGE